jgi:hypothetical protein
VEIGEHAPDKLERGGAIFAIGWQNTVMGRRPGKLNLGPHHTRQGKSSGLPHQIGKIDDDPGFSYSPAFDPVELARAQKRQMAAGAYSRKGCCEIADIVGDSGHPVTALLALVRSANEDFIPAPHVVDGSAQRENETLKNSLRTDQPFDRMGNIPSGAGRQAIARNLPEIPLPNGQEISQ